MARPFGDVTGPNIRPPISATTRHDSNSMPRTDYRSNLQRHLTLEKLEAREVNAISTVSFSNATLMIRADNTPTSATLEASGNSLFVRDQTTGRLWLYAANPFRSIRFDGGTGNDRFVNNVPWLTLRAYGGAGNDWLEGSNGHDH